MVLNGWKDIAAYLGCGVRTAQRWMGMGLPVSRIGNGNRGKVIALSEKLNAWIRRNGSSAFRGGDYPEAFATLSKTLNQTVELLDRAREQHRNFLRVEISTGKQLAHIATFSRKPQERTRRTAAARRAYDEANRLLLRARFLPDGEVKEFRGELQALKHALQELGEAF